MAKILRLARATTKTLQKQKAGVLKELNAPANLVRASYVRQFLTCGKANCRCGRGHKHGPFHYVVQCLQPGRIHKFLLKTAEQKSQARASIDAYVLFQKKVEELSQINTELLRRGVL